MGVDFYKSIYPDWYKEWLFSALGLNEGDETQARFLEPLFALNKNWLQENYNQKEYKWNDSDVAKSYALYYMTINLPKLWTVLKHSGDWPEKNISSISSIVEYGCGPGTFIWSYLFYLYRFYPKALQNLKRIKAIDISREHLQIAKSLFGELKKRQEFSHLELEIIEQDWRQKILETKSDLHIFGNSLIESGIDSTFLKQEEKKNILIIEPGTLEHFKRLRLLKKEFAENNWHIHFPCPNSGECPMDLNNWCHFNVNRFMLPFIQKMSSNAGRKNHKHSFSSFLISKHNNGLDKHNWRILSNNRKVKRTSIRYICNGILLKEAVLNRKERSEINKDFSVCETACCCYTSSELKNSRILSADTFRQTDKK